VKSLTLSRSPGRAVPRPGALAANGSSGGDGGSAPHVWRRRRAAVRRIGGSLLVTVSGIAILIGLWWLIASTTVSVRLPAPPEVFNALISGWDNIPSLQFVAFQSGGILSALAYTSVTVIVGVAIGSAAGFVLGAVMGRVDAIRDLLSFPLLLLGTVPLLVLLPFMLIWFGASSRIVQSALVIAFALVTVAAVTQQATEDIGARYVDYATCLGASRARILREVILPGTVPAVVGAVRVAAATGWSFATVAELLGGQSGTGKLIQAMQGISSTDVILAVVIALGTAAVILDALISTVGAMVLRWQE